MTSKQRSDIKKNAERKEAQKVAHTLQLCQQNLSMAEVSLGVGGGVGVGSEKGQKKLSTD